MKYIFCLCYKLVFLLHLIRCKFRNFIRMSLSVIAHKNKLIEALSLKCLVNKYVDNVCRGKTKALKYYTRARHITWKPSQTFTPDNSKRKPYVLHLIISQSFNICVNIYYRVFRITREP